MVIKYNRRKPSLFSECRANGHDIIPTIATNIYPKKKELTKAFVMGRIDKRYTQRVISAMDIAETYSSAFILT
jgi:hypothetical protein